MKNNLLSWLTDTGLDEQRAQLYLTALSKGESTAKELADAMNIGRTAIYDNLRILEERGYITTIHEGKRKTYLPLHPQELYKKFNSQKEQLKDLLPTFLAMYAEQGKQPFVQVFKGNYAAREVYEDILNVTKKEYVYFSASQTTIKMIDRNYIEKWIDRRVKKGIHSRALRVKDKTIPDAPKINKEDEFLRQIRYLPGYVDIKSTIYIYENNIGVISTAQEEAAFIIFSPDMAFSMRQIFEFIWSVSMKS